MDGSRPAALSGSFADFKIIKTRAIAQLVIEIPIEQADAALAALGGVPRADREIHVALARLRDAPEPERVPVPPPDPELQRGPAKSEKARANYQAMDEMEQARVRSVMLCKELKFRQWLSLRDPPMTEDEAAGELCAIIGVESRREIATNEAAFNGFKRVEDAYHLETKYAENLR